MIEEVKDILKKIFIGIVMPIILVMGIVWSLIKINIAMGPYKCINIDGNEIICKEVWRSHGTLYGVTLEGKTIDLKSCERVKE